MKTLIKFHADERVDLPDAEKFAGELSLEENARFGREVVLPTGRTGGAAATSARILSGFNITNISGGTCTITRGSGFFPLRRDGAVTYGHLAGDCGSASQSINLSAQPADDYAIFVRITHTDGDKENRVHWDDNATSEVALFVNTRETLTWEWTYRSSSAGAPSGGDWVKVWELTVDGSGNITASADYRHFLFEGDAKSGSGQWKHEWGTGNDRNADRATYGVQDLHDFVSAFRQKMADIQGSYYEWWETPSVDLTTLEHEHYGAAKSGRHKHVTFGDTGAWAKLSLEDGGTGHNAILEFSDKNKSAVYFRSFESGGTRYLAQLMYPYDHTGSPIGDLQNGDSIYWALGPNWQDNFDRISATKVRRRFRDVSALPYVDEVTFQMGAGYNITERGIVLPSGASYHLSSRQVFQIVDLTSIPDTGSSWELTLGAGAGVGDVVANDLYLGTATDEDLMFAFIHDFPHNATLDEVHIYWWQDGAANTHGMRLWVARRMLGSAMTTQGVSSHTLAAQHTVYSLNSSQDYIEYAYGGGGTPYDIDTFTCNQNNTSLTRGRDEILLGIMAGDKSVVNYRIFAIGLLFTYTEACPFPAS